LEQKRNKIHNGIHSKHPRPNDSTFHGFDGTTAQDKTLVNPLKLLLPTMAWKIVEEVLEDRLAIKVIQYRRPLQNAWVDMTSSSNSNGGSWMYKKIRTITITKLMDEYWNDS
jgi:hypothetical protein